MDTTAERHAIGGNFPPLAEQLNIHYDGAVMLERHTDLARDLGELETECAAFVAIDDDEGNTRGAELVRKIRILIKRVDDAKELENRPLLTASRAVGAFIRALDNPDSGVSVTGNKKRIERMIGAFAQAKAERERLARVEAARLERLAAQEKLDRAAAEELANKPKVAEILVEQGQKREQIAEVHDRVAAGPIHEMARTKTDHGTTTLTTDWTWVIAEPDALKATLGPLRDSFTADAIDAAIRRFKTAEVAARRIPELPGVMFEKDYKGTVR